MNQLIEQVQQLFKGHWTIQAIAQQQVVATHVYDGHVYRALFYESGDGWVMAIKEPDLRDDVFLDLQGQEIKSYRFAGAGIFLLTTNPKLCIICEDCAGIGGFQNQETGKYNICYRCDGNGHQVNPILAAATFEA